MTSRHGTEIQELVATIDSAGLGPAASVEAISINGTDVLKVDLDGKSPRKARALLRWIDLITVWDMVAGKFRAGDAELRLNIRGQLPRGGAVIVVVPFDELIEADQTSLINDSIKRQEPAELVRKLAAIESSSEAG